MLIEGITRMGRAPDGTTLREQDRVNDAPGIPDVSRERKDSMEPTGSGGRAESGAADDSTLATWPRTILVDGFNVLHAVLLGKDRADGWWRRKHRERLLERLCEWRGGPDQIWVAFDGTRPDESIWAEPVAVIVAPPIVASLTETRAEGEIARHSAALTTGATIGPKQAPTIHTVFVESADDWIVRRARKARDPSRVIVVSADRKVAGRARSAGCEILTPWTFMGGCGPPPTKDQLEFETKPGAEQ